MGRVVLLTGRPGIGKTTCLRRALARLDRPAGGFFTEEVREGGRRVGFDLVTLDGQRAALARVGEGGGPRVGPYGVSVETVERVGTPAVRAAVRAGRLVVIDEIGKMEMTAAAFREAVEEALRSPVDVLGVILSTSHPWADTIKAHPGAELVTVTLATRDALPGALADRLEPSRRGRA
jgi:nucleoside-triphosphatase